MRYKKVVAFMLVVSLVVGIAYAAVKFGEIRFHYKIGGGEATMSPSSYTIELGTLTPDSSGSGVEGAGFVHVSTSGVEIVHTLTGDLGVFDKFDVTVRYYEGSMMVVAFILSLTSPSYAVSPASGTYALYTDFDYHVMAGAASGTEGTVWIELSYQTA